jgi:ribonuclease BN (tRNA processing enzyme)
MGLRITLLGTGVGIPQPGRSQAAVLLENQGPLLFDCGAGTLLRLSQAGIDMGDLDTVVLSHLHLDHVSDLLALANARYLSQLPGLKVYGPAGTKLWFERAQSAFPNLALMEVSLHELRPMDCISLKGCDIFAEEAKHSVTALAYRIEGQEKAVVYSGDTEPYQRIASLAEGADLLIHECSFPEPFEVTNHTTPAMLGSLAKGVGQIVLTHFYPQAEGHTEEMAREVSELSGLPVVAGWDLMTLVV